MGHVNGKEIYKKLGQKIDGLTAKAPWNDTFYAILKELYTPDEAEITVKMPYSLSSIERIPRVTQCEETRLRKILDSLSSKRLVIDFWINGKYQYIPSPMVIGIFNLG